MRYHAEAENVIDNIAHRDVDVLLKYLNVDILQKYKERSLDYNAFTFGRNVKGLIIGGGSTFHEFIQPLVQALQTSQEDIQNMKKNEEMEEFDKEMGRTTPSQPRKEKKDKSKMRVFSYIRVHLQLLDIHSV